MQKKGSILKTKLYRKNDGKIIAGVCAGLAEALNIDVTIVRIIFAFACVYWQFLILIYLLLALILPEKSSVITQPETDHDASDQTSSASDAAQNGSADTAQRETSARQQASQHPIQPHDSHSISILLAVILICSGVGLFITRVVFHYSIGFTDFMTFVLLGVGLYVLISGLMDNGKADQTTRTTKIVIGSVMWAVRLVWVFIIFGFMIFTLSDLLASLRYMWPLLIVAIGLNILLPNKKASMIIWLTFLVVILAYALLNEFGGLHFTGALFSL
jgi:phage shock protein PspC (stress-responsive transcriptional regulator)